MSKLKQSYSSFHYQLKGYYTWYTGGFFVFLVVLAICEQLGMSRTMLGYIFLFATVGLYAGIGIMSRTTDAAEYYVAGRRVPALFNGMATGADWMSAASFIGMAGTLYLSGFDGLAFVTGWTGGYCLVAMLLAPYLRKFGQYTIPDFLGERYGGNVVRSIGIFAAILCSFTYVIAQIYGVGLITSRFTGLEFGIGVFVGLGGILVCSFLGGMRAVTWTQVAQYIILIVAYLTPLVWLSVKYTGNPIPQIAYGGALAKVSIREKELNADPKELEVRAIMKGRSDAAVAALKEPDTVYAKGRAELESTLSKLKSTNATKEQIAMAEKALFEYPRDLAAAKHRWEKDAKLAARAEPIHPHAEPFKGSDQTSRDKSRRNFLGIVFCMMIGTASLPHILVRYYTTPSVREARKSVFWSIFFIFLLYVSAPALAVLAKYDVYHFLVGSQYSQLPAWAANWARIDPSLLSITDFNRDGIVQLAEIVLGTDIIVLATPEIAGLPYVISGLVAAGGLAAALSTADGLLLTIANALSHDLYYKMIDPSSSTAKRVAISKSLLLVVALIAAYVTSLRPGNILFLVGSAFSLAGSAFFPAMVCGVFWKRANKWGAICGMLAGLGTAMFYMVRTYDFFGGVPANQWFGFEPIAAGVFGVPIGVIVLVVVSLITKPPPLEIQEFVEHCRYPNLENDVNTEKLISS